MKSDLLDETLLARLAPIKLGLFAKRVQKWQINESHRKIHILDHLRCFPLLFTASNPRHTQSIAPDGFVTGASGARLYYRVMGSGRDTVVVVHGGPGAGMNSVIPSLRPLAERYVLIFYDQRGGGRSELPADTTMLRPEYFVEDLEAVRRHFGLERMNVITHSFGAIIVARYAMK